MRLLLVHDHYGMPAFVVFRPYELVKPRYHRVDSIAMIDQQLDKKVLVVYRVAVVVQDVRTSIIQRYAVVAHAPPYVVYLPLSKLRQGSTLRDSRRTGLSARVRTKQMRHTRTSSTFAFHRDIIRQTVSQIKTTYSALFPKCDLLLRVSTILSEYLPTVLSSTTNI